jgi:hypothetical protein
MPATNVDAGVQPQTLYQLYLQRPKTGYQLAYGEYMANPNNKAFIKALPGITLADGSTTRRGVDKRHFAEIWKNMDPDRKAVYQAAGAEALEAMHVRIGAPSKRSRGSEDGDEDGGEDGSEGGSRKKSRRSGAGGGRKSTTNLAKADITGVSITGQFLHNKRWHIELPNGVVLKVGKVFSNKDKAMGIKSAGSAQRSANPFILWLSAKSAAVKAAQEQGTFTAELAEEFGPNAKYTELSPELKAKYIQMAADMKAAAAAAAPVSASASGDDSSSEEEDEEEEEADEEADEEEEADDEE